MISGRYSYTPFNKFAQYFEKKKKKLLCFPVFKSRYVIRSSDRSNRLFRMFYLCSSGILWFENKDGI